LKNERIFDFFVVFNSIRFWNLYELSTALYVLRVRYNSSEPEIEPEWTESQQQVHQSLIKLLEDYRDLVNIGKMTEGEYLYANAKKRPSVLEIFQDDQQYLNIFDFFIILL